MSFSATVFNVLIASPSDVPKEREAIANCLRQWNALHSQETQKVLLPVMWESHSAPSMAGRPQSVINAQVVKQCDMLIGAFWTRLGTPTGEEDSGTVEEIKEFLRLRKPVMLYYSEADIPRSQIDLKQLERLEAFKQSIRDKGIQEQYSSIEELRSKLFSQLTIVLRDMSVGPVVSPAVVKAAKASTNPSLKLEAEPANAEQLAIYEYSELSFVVCGNTLALKEQMKSLGGKWIKLRDGSHGWNFSKRRLKDVASLVKLPPLLERKFD